MLISRRELKLTSSPARWGELCVAARASRSFAGSSMPAGVIAYALEAFECGLTVIVVHGDDGHPFELEIVAHEFRTRASLRRTEVNAAEDIIAAACDVGMYTVGGDEGHARTLKDRRRRAPRRGVAPGDSKFHAILADELVRGEDSLLGLRLIVVGHELDALPEHATG